jgi:hypothetical protein
MEAILLCNVAILPLWSACQLFNSVSIGMIFSQLFMTMIYVLFFSLPLDWKTAEGVRQGGGTSESN